MQLKTLQILNLGNIEGDVCVSVFICVHGMCVCARKWAEHILLMDDVSNSSGQGGLSYRNVKCLKCNL